MPKKKFHALYQNNEAIQSKNTLEDYKNQTKQLLKNLQIDPENSESLEEEKKNALNDSLECFKWGGISLFVTSVLAVDNTIHFFYKSKWTKTQSDVLTYALNNGKPSSIFLKISDWTLFLLELVFIMLGTMSSLCGISNFIDYLKLNRKLKKAKNLKHEIEKILINQPHLIDSEIKTYLNLLAYHTNSREFIYENNYDSEEENQAGPSQNTLYRSPSPLLKLQTRSRLLINALRVKKSRIAPIKNNWISR